MSLCFFLLSHFIWVHIVGSSNKVIQMHFIDRNNSRKTGGYTGKIYYLKTTNSIYTPFTQLLQTRVCFTNAGINLHLRRGNTQGKKTCNSRISIVPISNITFYTLCTRAFLRNNGASKQYACVNYRYQRFHFVKYYLTTTILFHLMYFRWFLFILVHISN